MRTGAIIGLWLMGASVLLAAMMWGFRLAREKTPGLVPPPFLTYLMALVYFEGAVTVTGTGSGEALGVSSAMALGFVALVMLTLGMLFLTPTWYAFFRVFNMSMKKYVGSLPN